VVGDYRCAVSPDWHNLGAGAFSVPYVKILPGESVTLNAVSPTGDNTLITTTSTGETPCIEVYAAGHVQPAPGSPPDPTPFRIQVSHLVQSLFPTLRVVLRRGSTTLIDQSTSNDYFNGDLAVQPQPGDVVDIYRPQGAPAPTFTATIPQVSSVFDASIDRLAVDGPAARVLYASPCRAFGCVNENVRSTRDAPAGRTILDFSKPEGASSPVDMRPDDFVFTQYVNPENTLTYAFRAQSGDLVPPVQSFKLAGKIKISALVKALKKGLKIKLKSNEVGTAKLTLGKFASAKGNVKVGTNTLTLKFSKSGKKALKKFAAKGKKAKPLSVTLTSVVKDASGNASTVTKTTKIKP
jgi:hypothetical protein